MTLEEFVVHGPGGGGGWGLDRQAPRHVRRTPTATRGGGQPVKGPAFRRFYHVIQFPPGNQPWRRSSLQARGGRREPVLQCVPASAAE